MPTSSNPEAEAEAEVSKCLLPLISSYTTQPAHSKKPIQSQTNKMDLGFVCCVTEKIQNLTHPTRTLMPTSSNPEEAEAEVSKCLLFLLSHKIQYNNTTSPLKKPIQSQTNKMDLGLVCVV